MSEPSAPRLEAAIRTTLTPRLREDGFAGSGRTFRRICDASVQVVNVQGSRWGGQFAINLAVHPLAIPDLRGNPPDPKKINEELCEFRRRLSPSNLDHWWTHDSTEESMLAAVSDAAGVYVRIGRQLLRQISGPDSPINTVLPAAFVLGQFDFAGFGSTKIRMALALARLRHSQGRSAEASAFARHGLEALDGATMLRHELESLAAQQ